MIDRMLHRWLPTPVLSAGLFGAWLMLNGSVSPGHLLLAAALAFGLPLATRHLRDGQSRRLRAGAAARLALTVTRDAAIANIDVARRVLGRENRLRPAFVRVPLDIHNPHGAVALMAIVSLTPGTLSAELSPDARHLLIHALHLEDEAALVAAIKSDYETPLR